jgi:hypothetical protein
VVPAVLGAALALAAIAVVLPRPKSAPARYKQTPTVVIASNLPAPVVIPPPAPVIETWLAHRDLAVTYTNRGQHDDAFREVTASVADNAAAAGADPALARAAVDALTSDRLAFVIGAFRENPALIDALADATSKGANSELRHAAQEGLRQLGQEPRADVVAIETFDVEQAATCSVMRAAFKKLRATKDPRVKQFTADLRARGRKDPHVRCLKRLLRHG